MPKRSPYLLIKEAELFKLLEKDATLLQSVIALSLNLSALGYEKVARKSAKTKVEKVEDVKDNGVPIMVLALSNYKITNKNFSAINLDMTLAGQAAKNKAAKAARSFCDYFNLEFTMQNCKEYIEVVEKVVGASKISVNTLGSTYERAVKYYTAYNSIINMDNQHKVMYASMESKFKELRAKVTRTPYEPTINEMSDILQAVETCIKYEASVEDWIEAQFEMMEVFTSLPYTYQLHGDGALARYNQWYAKHGTRVKRPVEINDKNDFLRSL